MHIGKLMDLELLNKMVQEGFVTARRHDSLPLVILNYTPKAQYEWVWNDVTLKCRGLIYNSQTLEVVARPFEKFFNWDQGVGAETWQNPMPPPGPAIRMEKMDGSLGILYDGGFHRNIATRGSFHSEQATWATEFIRQYECDIRFYPSKSKTYLFEIIYPENRIVVDYGEYKGLVLIDVIDNETGESDLQEFDDCAWPDKVTRTILFNGFDSGQATDIPKGDEGFVYLWPTRNFRTKMKSAEYIELHRLVSRLSEKTVWEMLVSGKTVDQIKDGLPDEFHEFVDKTYKSIMDETLRITYAAGREVMKVKEQLGVTNLKTAPRKDVALAVKDNPFKKYIFLALDGKPIYPVALAASKPKTNKSLVNAEDI